MKVRWLLVALLLLLTIAVAKAQDVAPSPQSEDTVLFYQAQLAYQLKEYGKSLSIVAQYLARFPSSPQAYLLHGLNLVALNDEQSAEVSFNQALGLADDSKRQDEFALNIGKTYYQRRNFERALHYFDKLSMTKDPTMRQKALYYRGLTRFEISTLKRAIGDFKAVSQGPDIKMRDTASSAENTVAEKDKTFSLTAGYRFFYDDNVILLPRQGIYTTTSSATGIKSTTSAGKAGTGQVLFGVPGLRWGEKVSYFLRDDVSWGYHYEDSVRSYDFLNNTATLNFRSDKNPYLTAFFYSLEQHSSFLKRKGDFNILSVIFDTQVGSDLWVGENFSFTPKVSFSAGNFHDTQITPPDNRDALTIGGDGLTTIYYLLREAYIRAGFTYRYSFAKGKNYDYRELGAPFTVTFPLILGTDISLGTYLFWRKFVSHLQGRNEKEQTLTANWTIPITHAFLLQMNLIASFVDSTHINFDYERRAYSAAFSYTF